MKQITREFLVEEVGGQFVVVDRHMWDQEKPDALRSMVGSTRLAAGPFDTKEEAEAARSKLI